MDDLKKNLWKIILVVIGIVGGIGPFTFLKGCFKSNPNTSVIINPCQSNYESPSSANSNYDSPTYLSEEPIESSQSEISDNIIIRDFSFIGCYDFSGNEVTGDGMPDIHIEINPSKNEVTVNGSYSTLDGNCFTYAGAQFKLYSNTYAYDHLVGEVTIPYGYGGSIYNHYKAQ